MIRKLKALSLALGAVFAMGAVMASSASAVTDVFTNSKGAGADLLTGVGTDHVFSIGNSKFECTTSKFAATATQGDKVITADVIYESTPNVTPHVAKEHCLGPLNHKIVVDMNGCSYDLNGETTGVHKGVAGNDATVWITCPVGKEIQITDTSVGVTVSVHEQTPTEGGVIYTNLPKHPGGEAIEVTATVTGITYTCAPAFLCALQEISAEANNSTYTGHVKMTCYEDKNVKPEITPANEGPQTGCKTSTV